jgi:hypothetical protein
VSGIRNEVVAVRWGVIRVSVTGCPFWRIVSWIPRYEGTAPSMSAVKAASDASSASSRPLPSRLLLLLNGWK